jgi:hypothetical protein
VRIFICILLTLSLGPYFAQDLKVKVVSTNFSPEVNQQFKLTYKLVLDGSGSVQISGNIGIKQPNYNNFTIVSQKAGNPGFSFGGFDTEMTVHQYIVVLKPKKKGTLTIDPMAFVIGDKEYKSKSVTIEAGANTSGNVKAPSANSNLFGKIHLSKSSIFIGEPVVATMKVYSRYNRLSISDADYPMPSGFWNEEIKAGSKGWPATTERINGVAYNVFTIKKDLLYPQKSGKLKFPAFSIDLVANRTFFNSGSEITIESNAPSIQVNEIENAPSNFSGLVGTFTMAATISKTELSADEGIDVNIKIKGKGNLQQLDKVDFEFPLDFDTYDPEVDSKFSSSTAGISGHKTFNYLSIPRSGGEFKVGPIEVVFFDPKLKKFKTMKSETWDVKVEKNGQKSGSSLSSTDQQNVELLSEGIRHIRSETELFKNDDLLFGTTKFWILLFTPFIFFVGLAVVLSRRKANPKDESVEKIKKAGKSAINALKSAQEGLTSNNPGKFNEAMLSGMFGYLNNKLGLDMAHMSKSSMLESILDKGGKTETAQKYIDIIEKCEMARYAPMTESSSAETYSDGVKIIEQLEGELNV